MNRSSHGRSEVGFVRLSNEDAMLVDDALGLYAVADGIGGLPGGAEASAHTLDLLRSEFATLAWVGGGWEELFQRINREILATGRRLHGEGYGTTLTCAWIHGMAARICQVGDSAAYLLRAGRLQALTREQTVAGELAATMSAEQAALLPTRYQHMLTQCVGVDAALEPDFLDLELRPDDRLLLCTDGVSRTLGEDTLAHRLADAGSPRACVRDLFRAVWRMGAPDNLTAVVVDIGD